MNKKTMALACAAAVCGAAFAAEEEKAGGWAYNPGEGVSFNEQTIVSAEFSLAFDSKYLSYGLVDNNHPILTPGGSLTFFDWVSFEAEAIFDVTKYGSTCPTLSRCISVCSSSMPVSGTIVFTPTSTMSSTPTPSRLSTVLEAEPTCLSDGG